MSAQALGVLGFIAEWAKQLRWREKNENLLIAIWSFLPVQAVKKSVQARVQSWNLLAVVYFL